MNKTNPEDIDKLKELATTFNIVRKQMQLYPKGHPIIQQPLEKFYNLLKELLEKKHVITLGVSKDFLLIEEIPISLKESIFKDLESVFLNLNIESLTFEKGIEFKEVENLLNLLSSRLDVSKEVNFVEEFIKRGITNVKINKIFYKKVSDKDKALPEKRLRSKPAIQEKLEDTLLLYLKKEQPLSEETEDKIFQKLITNPKDIARLIVENSRSKEELLLFLEKFFNLIKDLIETSRIKISQNFIPVINKITRNLLKATQESNLITNFAEIEAILSRENTNLTYKAQLALLLKQYTENKSIKSLIPPALKMFKNTDELKRIASELKSKLLETGMSPEEFNNFYSSLYKQLTPEERMVKIPASQLKILYKKAKEFDKELERRVAFATQELNKVNRRLAAEKERIDNIIRNMSDGLVVVDPEGRIILMNPAAEKILGVSADKEVGKILVDELKDEHLLALTHGKLQDTVETISKEIRLISPKGNTAKTIKASQAIVENITGNTVGIISVLSDITKQKEIDEMKDNFISQVTHELRAPIISVQKSINLLLKGVVGKINKTQKKFLSLAVKDLNRLEKLINDILDMSKLEAGKIKLNLELVDINNLINEVTESLAIWIKEKQINLELKLDPSLPKLLIDPAKITQVIVNLLSNALKFTPSGGKITIESKHIQKFTGNGKPVNLVEVSVKDTGIGIETKDLKRIFNKFEQVSLAYPVGVSGSGLGLSISKEIIKLHNGHIWAESQTAPETERGSRFIFQLPIKTKEKKNEK